MDGVNGTDGAEGGAKREAEQKRRVTNGGKQWVLAVMYYNEVEGNTGTLAVTTRNKGERREGSRKLLDGFI